MCIRDSSTTSFDAGVASVSRVLVGFMLVMCPIVFVLSGVTKGDWLAALLFSISIAVGITPQMLPVIVTTCLARGAEAMRAQDVVVKDISSIQNLGAMDVLCCDKTGTLTRDKIVLERHLDVMGRASDRVLRHAYLNSVFQTGLRNLMDEAIIERAEACLLYTSTPGSASPSSACSWALSILWSNPSSPSSRCRSPVSPWDSSSSW